MDLTWSTLNLLEQEHGDSLYIVDLDAFKANYHEFLGAFRRFYPDTNIAYSYKTNYTPKLCSLVMRWGGYAEVVSRMEYELARLLGVEPARIVFNGPYKTSDDITVALRQGAVVNLDWPYQAEIVSEVARSFPENSFRVGLRVSFPIPSSRPSRFGFLAGSLELQDVLARLRNDRNVIIAGLHCHFLTADRSPQDYGFIAGRMLEIADSCFGEAPDFLNLGGGFFSKMKEELRAQLGITVPTYGQYAEAIATRFAERYPNGNGPELILEPGICLTADVVKFAARVIDVHHVESRNLALVSGSIYDIKPTLNSRNLPMQVLAGERAAVRTLRGKIDIVGFTCMEHDVLFTGFEGTVAPGDYVVFENVGAYTNVLRPPFIRECPAILGWNSQSGGFEVLKRRGILSDIFGPYRF